MPAIVPLTSAATSQLRRYAPRLAIAQKSASGEISPRSASKVRQGASDKGSHGAPKPRVALPSTMICRPPSCIQSDGGSGSICRAIKATAPSARSSKCRPVDVNPSVDGDAAASTRMATPSNCSTMFAQIPWALPPRTMHRKR